MGHCHQEDHPPFDSTDKRQLDGRVGASRRVVRWPPDKAGTSLMELIRLHSVATTNPATRSHNVHPSLKVTKVFVSACSSSELAYMDSCN